MTFPHEHHYLLEDQKIISNAKKSPSARSAMEWVIYPAIISTTIMAAVRIKTRPWHMASHSAAMVISILAYRLGRSRKLSESLSFGAGKFIPLGGYTSALILAMISILMAQESVRRLFKPEGIHFNQAIGIACIGLCVNLLSAWILEGRHDHHDEEHKHEHEHEHEHEEEEKHHHDHNLRSAYVHVLADALTSVLAIFALTAGKVYGLGWMDPVMGIVGSIVILKWAYDLCRETASELLDVHSRLIPPKRVRAQLEKIGVSVLDLHTWRIAPNAVACELVVSTQELKGSDYYREIILNHFPFQHLVVEERLKRLR